MASKLSESTPEYQIGDVVVYRNFFCDQLHIVDVLYEDDPTIVGISGFKKRETWLKGFTKKISIRHATKAERKTKRRLETPY